VNSPKILHLFERASGSSITFRHGNGSFCEGALFAFSDDLDRDSGVRQNNKGRKTTWFSLWEVRSVKKSALVGFGLIAGLASCTGPSSQQSSPLPASGAAALDSRVRPSASSPINHIVIIIQENRTPDNLFQGLPGADIASSGLNSKGQTVPLHSVPLETRYDMSHAHESFGTEYDGGRMDGFDLDNSSGQCSDDSTCAYAYVPQSETQPYLDMASQYVFGDRMFQTNQGPSFPSHQYLISGTSTTQQNGSLKAADNPYERDRANGGGCDAPADALVDTIDPQGKVGNPVYPCFERPTLGDVLDAKSVSWRYYQMELGTGLWHAYDAIRHIRFGPDYANVITPSDAILHDIASNKLANVSWVTPAGSDSDHAGNGGKGGPAWVTSVVNAMGDSKYWKDCAIFVVWDDWGGWYDHVPPQIFNSYELGFRVPLIVVSPYAKRGYVSHTQYEFGSILKFVEETFGTGSLNTTDVRANSIDDAFNFNAHRRTFVPIRAPRYNVERNVPDSD
jgi:phospholipase C